MPFDAFADHARGAPHRDARPETDAQIYERDARASSLLRARALPAPFPSSAVREDPSVSYDALVGLDRRAVPGRGPLADGEGEAAQGCHRQTAQGCGVSHLARTFPTGRIRRAVTVRVFPRGVPGARHPAMVRRTQVVSVSRRVLEEGRRANSSRRVRPSLVDAASSSEASGDGAGGRGFRGIDGRRRGMVRTFADGRVRVRVDAGPVPRSLEIGSGSGCWLPLV